MKGGGRGYYRNISLLSAWAHAPFMHNNAIGPGDLRQAERPRSTSTPRLRRSPRQAAREPAGCWPFDPSVEGRYALYMASMQELLDPDGASRRCSSSTRHRRRHRARCRLLGRDIGLSLTIPAGFPAVDVNSLRYKDLSRTWSSSAATRPTSRRSTRRSSPPRGARNCARGSRDPSSCSRPPPSPASSWCRPQGGGGRPGPGPHAPGRQRLRPALLFEPPRAPENSGHRFGESPERARQAGAHRLRGDALRVRR